MTAHPDLFPDAPATRQPANDDVGNAPGVSLAGLTCAQCGGAALDGVAIFDAPRRGVVALCAPGCAAAAGVWPWNGVPRA